jgi:hypothetical protein
MGILSEMFADESTDSQTYYYTDKGRTLKEKFEELSDYGDKMWLMDLAVWQIDQSEIHDLVFEALQNSDLAKKLGFKKLFIDLMRHGDKVYCEKITEEWLEELGECNRFDSWEMIRTYNAVMNARGITLHVTPYPNLAYAICEKVRSLRLAEETRLIVECRALLTSYDDFMLGLRMNQSLYTTLEQRYRDKALQLQASYEQRIRQLLSVAERQGVALNICDEMRLLGEGGEACGTDH